MLIIPAPPLTRTSSANTIQGVHASSTPRPQSDLLRRPSYQRPTRFETIPQTTTETRSSSRASTSADPASNSDNSSESDTAASNIRSQAFKRPPPFFTSRASTRHSTLRHEEDDDNDDAEDDDAPAFLPIQEERATHEPSTRTIPQHRMEMKFDDSPAVPRQSTPPTAHSSASSASSCHAATTPAADPNRRAPPQQQRPRGPLSPRRTTELSRRSPGQRGLGPGTRPGSDGTPSMGSSFSDLDGKSRAPKNAPLDSRTERRRRYECHAVCVGRSPAQQHAARRREHGQSDEHHQSGSAESLSVMMQQRSSNEPPCAKLSFKAEIV